MWSLHEFFFNTVAYSYICNKMNTKISQICTGTSSLYWCGWQVGHSFDKIKMVLMNTESVYAAQVGGNFNRNTQCAQQPLVARWGNGAKQDGITKPNIKPLSLLLFLPGYLKYCTMSSLCDNSTLSCWGQDRGICMWPCYVSTLYLLAPSRFVNHCT